MDQSISIIFRTILKTKPLVAGSGGCCASASHPQRSAQLHEVGPGEAGVLADRDIVPFETVILEAALDEVVSVLASEAAVLVCKTYPCLDQLSKGFEVSSEDLQLIRTLKNVHQKLRTRVDVVRLELEQLLGAPCVGVYHSLTLAGPTARPVPDTMCPRVMTDGTLKHH